MHFLIGLAVIYFAIKILIVIFLGYSYKGFSDKTQTGNKRITHHSTVRQKQARILPVGKLLVTERYHFKRNSFFAFAACELSVMWFEVFVAIYKIEYKKKEVKNEIT